VAVGQEVAKTSETLFLYLKDIIYEPQKAQLDLADIDEDFHKLGQGLAFLAKLLNDFNAFATDLSKGNLNVTPPGRENIIAGPLKSLHGNLQHLTWQSQQVAKGDYKQRVDFLGEFSDAFNTMIEQLEERQNDLEAEIEHRNTLIKSLEAGNQFLANVTRNAPSQIFIVDAKTREILLVNEKAEAALRVDPAYIKRLIDCVQQNDHKGNEGYNKLEAEIEYFNKPLLVSILSYMVTWEDRQAIAMVVEDITAEKEKFIKLENQAYKDALTGLYNRFYGMEILGEWIDAKKQFVLVFIDLDFLKYINDTFGHYEGDRYILTAAEYFKSLNSDILACRLGGDEFMLLMPDIGEETAQEIMKCCQERIQNDEYLEGKEFKYGISFGTVEANKDTNISQSEILHLADERMYENKRLRKANRQ